MTQRHNCILILLTVIAAALLPGGCYSLDTLYRDDVRTVYVEMFDSKSFRRQVEFDLTRALCKQIEMQTPYQLSSDRDRADTILYGVIESIDEQTVTQQRDIDRPVQNRVIITATVSWKDMRSGEFLVENRRFRFSSDYAVLLSEGSDSATLKAVNEMARQIVQIMEKKW